MDKDRQDLLDTLLEHGILKTKLNFRSIKKLYGNCLLQKNHVTFCDVFSFSGAFSLFFLFITFTGLTLIVFGR